MGGGTGGVLVVSTTLRRGPRQKRIRLGWDVGLVPQLLSYASSGQKSMDATPMWQLCVGNPRCGWDTGCCGDQWGRVELVGSRLLVGESLSPLASDPRGRNATTTPPLRPFRTSIRRKRLFAIGADLSNLSSPQFLAIRTPIPPRPFHNTPRRLRVIASSCKHPQLFAFRRHRFHSPSVKCRNTFTIFRATPRTSEYSTTHVNTTRLR